jgi:regulatory protein
LIDPYPTALRLLAGRELTTAQLRTRLTRKGFTRAQIDEVVARLRDAGTLDDERAAMAAARTAAAVRRRGPLRVARELQALGIERDLARAAVARAFADVDERALVSRAIDAFRRRRGPRATPQALRACLVRQGFSADAIRAALGGAADDE